MLPTSTLQIMKHTCKNDCNVLFYKGIYSLWMVVGVCEYSWLWLHYNIWISSIWPCACKYQESVYDTRYNLQSTSPPNGLDGKIYLIFSGQKCSNTTYPCVHVWYDVSYYTSILLGRWGDLSVLTIYMPWVSCYCIAIIWCWLYFLH